MEAMEYYKLINNSIQFNKVELVSMQCIKRDQDEMKNKGNNVQIMLHREVNVLSETEAEIFLISKIGIEEGLFEFEIIYKGICFAKTELSKPQLEQYAYDHIVPLMLPYVRECIASTMARMGLPIFTLPTIDVINTLEANMEPEQE